LIYANWAARLRRDRQADLAEADAVDRAAEERFGERRADELPPELSTAHGPRGSLRDARRRLVERRAAEATPVPQSRPARLREGKRPWRKSTKCIIGRTRLTSQLMGSKCRVPKMLKGTKTCKYLLF
jgi:hypothetical protein